MQHHFNTDIAKEYDIVTAVLLDHFYFWIEKNRVNDKHFHDGRYWTYNSANALAELFPYLNARQVRYAIQKMVDNNLLMTGNYNENKYDRKLWYAITDFGYSILQNCQMYNINNNINNEETNRKPYISDEAKINDESIEQHTLVNSTEKQITTEKIDKDEISRWFDILYRIFPRKGNKLQARQTFEHKFLGLEIETAKQKVKSLKQTLETHCDIWRKEQRDEQYIPYFSSWLNKNVDDSPNRRGKK